MPKKCHTPSKVTAPAERLRAYWILFSIAFASLMVNVDTYSVNISLPTIAKTFSVTTNQVSWVVLSYQLTIISLLLVFGRLGDRLGLKRVFLGGFAVFTAGSLCCGLSSNLFMLVTSRAFQGIGASVLYGLTPAMVPKYMPEDMRGMAFGTLSTVAAVGITLGTPLGGLIAGLLSWHWVFFVNIPLGIAALLICRRLIPDDPAVAGLRDNQKTFDVPGALLSLVGAALLMFALSRGTALGWGSPWILGALGVSAAAWLGFVWQEQHCRCPLFDLSLFKTRGFAFSNLAGSLAYMILAGSNFLMPFYLIYVKGLPSGKAGGLYLVYSLTYMIVGPAVGALSSRVNPRTLIVVSTGVGALTSFGFARLLTEPGLWPVVTFFFFFAWTNAAFITLNNTVVMDRAPDGKQGVVAALFRMMLRLGMALGVCVFDAVFSSAVSSGAGMKVTSYAGLPVTVLSAGFDRAYCIGGCVYLAAMLLSLLAGNLSKSGATMPGAVVR